jgi:hypothetical protein
MLDTTPITTAITRLITAGTPEQALLAAVAQLFPNLTTGRGHDRWLAYPFLGPCSRPSIGQFSPCSSQTRTEPIERILPLAHDPLEAEACTASKALASGKLSLNPTKLLLPRASSLEPSSPFLERLTAKIVTL